MLIDIVRISLCQLINLTGCKNIAKQEKAIKRGLNYRAPSFMIILRHSSLTGG